MVNEMSPPGRRQDASSKNSFFDFFWVYLFVWILLLSSFIFLTMPILGKVISDQTGKRLETAGTLIDNYFSSSQKFSETSHSQLDALCKGFSQPRSLDAWVTIFSTKQEPIADSRIGNPIEERIYPRPEVQAALENVVGKSVRYSLVAHRRMAFVAYPHVEAGKIQGVIRLGVPYSSLHNALWEVYLKLAAGGVAVVIAAAMLRRFRRPSRLIL